MDNFQVPTTTTDVVNSLEVETELTPTRSQQPCRSRFPITNRLLNRFQPQNRFVDTTNYRECLRNYAAGMGGLVLDGCGGYIAPLSSDPSNPMAMKCMVCGCHRNYHRVEKNDSPVAVPENRSGHHFFHHHHPAPPLTPFIGQLIHPNYNLHSEGGISGSKKRIRTKFSHEQKLKMQELAERLEWKMKKDDEEMIEAFCCEIGVEKNVFKVWINNHKCTLGKRNAAGNEVETRDLQLQLLPHDDEGNDAAIKPSSPHENEANVSSSSDHHETY